MMNVGLHHRGVDPQLAAVLHAELHGSPHDEVIYGLEHRRRQPVEGVMLGHILAVEIGELAQRYPIGDAFAQPQFFERIRTSARNTCGAVRPRRPLSGSFRPRKRSQRTRACHRSAP
jgi:hypothetical protein